MWQTKVHIALKLQVCKRESVEWCVKMGLLPMRAWNIRPLGKATSKNIEGAQEYCEHDGQ